MKIKIFAEPAGNGQMPAAAERIEAAYTEWQEQTRAAIVDAQIYAAPTCLFLLVRHEASTVQTTRRRG